MGLIKLAMDNEIDDYYRFNKNVGTGLGAFMGAATGLAISDGLVNNRGKLYRAKNLLNKKKTNPGFMKLYNFKSISKGSKDRLKNIVSKYKKINALKYGGGALLGALALGGGLRALINHEQKHEKGLINSGKATLTLAR